MLHAPVLTASTTALGPLTHVDATIVRCVMLRLIQMLDWCGICLQQLRCSTLPDLTWTIDSPAFIYHADQHINLSSEDGKKTVPSQVGPPTMDSRLSLLTRLSTPLPKPRAWVCPLAGQVMSLSEFPCIWPVRIGLLSQSIGESVHWINKIRAGIIMPTHDNASKANPNGRGNGL